jgi:hydroxymethylglutaryl-CoA lyase
MGSSELGLPMRFPSPERAGLLPERVTIWEVGPRDGLQNESTVIPTETKLEFLRRLAAAGLPVVETTSFVRPEWVPQLADAEAVLDGLVRTDGVRYPVLVPNSRGLDRAMAAGVREVAVFASATETFSRRNLNRGLDEQFALFDPVVHRAVDAGLTVRGYVSMAFGDPWEGPVPVEQVVSAGRRLLDMGCAQLSIGDTIGVATPGHVETLLRGFPVDLHRLAVHFHDTYGQALANTYAALRLGVSTVDSSAGGLGGCPYAKSATGNLATEDLVWMLDGLGIEHGVDLAALVDTSRWMADKLGKPSPSRVVRALSGQ